MPTLAADLEDYYNLYNYEWPHQSLGYLTPTDAHFAVKVSVLWPDAPPYYCRTVVLTMEGTLVCVRKPLIPLLARIPDPGVSPYGVCLDIFAINLNLC